MKFKSRERDLNSIEGNGNRNRNRSCCGLNDINNAQDDGFVEDIG